MTLRYNHDDLYKDNCPICFLVWEYLDTSQLCWYMVHRAEWQILNTKKSVLGMVEFGWTGTV